MKYCRWISISCFFSGADSVKYLLEPAITKRKRFMTGELQLVIFVVKEALQDAALTGDLLQLSLDCRQARVKATGGHRQWRSNGISGSMTAAPIYLDHQATTPVDPRVVEAMSSYWNEEFGNAHSSNHAFGWRADEAVQKARQSIADLIGADAKEIVFTSGATEANNLAILGLLGHTMAGRTRVVVSAIEHKCVLQSSRQLSRLGYEVILAPVNPSGHVDVDALGKLINENTALVSIMAVNNEIGTIQPLEKISSLCHSAGAVFHSDAAQAATAIHIDVDHLSVDMMSL